MAVDFKKSETKDNLMRAFAGESQARNRYTFAAGQAKKENLQVIEAVFIYTANQEKEHAEIFYDHLKKLSGETIHIEGGYPVDISDHVLDLLKMAQHNEYEEHDPVYKKFGEKAMEEGFKDVAHSFFSIAEIEKVHGDRFGRFAKWMEENNITEGINIDEDTKRYYPYNNLASQVIGFCGSDNQGLDGIEAIYEKELKGSKGKITKMTDAKGVDIADTSEVYEDAIDGNDLILTIDSTIQGIAEKYLKEACIDNVCTDGGNIVIMNPQNGDILALAGYPNYNLNTPYLPNTEDLANIWDSLSQEEKNKNLQSMWRNKAVSDTYEPGSTFKLVTASASLEEGITTPDKEGEFSCTGSIDVAGTKMKCWRYYRPHGSESLRQALMNSCNPVFIGLGQKIGVHKYYEYLNKFGFLNRTGIDLPGEAGSIFLKEEKVGPVELRYNSFWSTF